MGGGGGKETDLHPDPTDFFHEDGGSKLLWNFSPHNPGDHNLNQEKNFLNVELPPLLTSHISLMCSEGMDCNNRGVRQGADFLLCFVLWCGQVATLCPEFRINLHVGCLVSVCP
jgi:hypothetical protein